MPKLGARLSAVLELVPRCRTAADIGCDHGKLALAMLEKCGGVIITDVSAPSLEKARRLFAAAGARADFRLGDGLSVLGEGEAQCAVIAGMGGLLIADILARGGETARCMALVLQPAQHAPQLRAFLRQNGYRIIDESMTLAGRRYYATMLVTAGAEESRLAPGIYDEAGPVLFARRDALALRSIVRRRAEIEKHGEAARRRNRARLELLREIEREWNNEKG